MLKLDTHDRLPDDGTRAAWEDLVRADPGATAFHTPRFLEVWSRVLGAGTRVRVRTAHRDGQLVGVVPEGIEREGSPTGPREVIRFLGGDRVSDYRGPVCRPGDRAEVARAYLGALAAEHDWDELVVNGLAADTGWGDHLVDAAEQAGLHVVDRGPDEVCPVVSLEDGYDAYLESLSSKERTEQRRKARKLARDVGAVELIDVPPEQITDRLDAFLDMAEGSDDPKARFFGTEHMQKFFLALADELADDGSLRLHLLDVAGAPGAAAVSLVWDGHWGVYNTAFDETLESLAPGMVLVGQLLRVAAEEGCGSFDLLRGDEDYKYRFGAVDRSLERLTISAEQP